MKVLLYCIVRDSNDEPARDIRGIDGAPVRLVRTHGIAGAASRGEIPSNPDLKKLLEYASVVENCCGSSTPIPMRYGCAFDDEEKLRQHLALNHPHYMSLLEEVEDCVEMGIRILYRCEKHRDAPAPSESMSENQSSGLNYLLARKETFRSVEQRSNKITALADECCIALTGCYRRAQAGVPIRVSGSRDEKTEDLLTSINFLVPRGLIGNFRAAFADMDKRVPAKLLLSGPWPPYNFVAGEGDGHELFRLLSTG